MKVGIIKEEAERQRLQREELEMELHNVKQQMLGVKSSNADVKRYASMVSELDSLIQWFLSVILTCIQKFG